MTVSSPNPHALAIRTAIAHNSSAELGVALLAARQAGDDAWKTEVIGKYTCWTRVLVNTKRSHLWMALRMAGANPVERVVFAGKQRLPLDVAIRHGNWPFVKRLLASGASLGPASFLPTVFWDVTQRWFASYRGPTEPFVGNYNERRRREEEWSTIQRQEWVELMEALWSKGYRPCPRMMSAWMIHLDASGHGLFSSADRNYLGSKRLAWVSRAWELGVRPLALSSDHPAIAAACPAMAMMLSATSAQDAAIIRPWVVDRLRLVAPTPQWVQVLKGDFSELLSHRYVSVRVGSGEDSNKKQQFLHRLDDLQQALEEAWAGHAWSADRWESTNYGSWAKAVDAAKWAPWCGISSRLICWAMRHGAPAGKIFHTMAATLFGSRSTEEGRCAALEAFFQAGLRWDTPLPKPNFTAIQWMEHLKLSKVLAEPGVARVHPHYREQDLSMALPVPTATAPRIRF